MVVAAVGSPTVKENIMKVDNTTVVRTRRQKGHSLTLHILFGWMLVYAHTIYFAVSKDHYFHV